jgi:hypothetical protein
MKKLLLALLLTGGICNAHAQQKSPAISQEVVTPKPIPTVTAPSTNPKTMSEAEYYKGMYELAKSEAEQAHTDVMTGYAVNIGFLVTLALAYVAVQWFKIRNQLQDFRKTVNQDIATTSKVIKDELYESINALGKKHNADFSDIDYRINTLVKIRDADLLFKNSAFAPAFNTYLEGLEYGIDREQPDNFLLNGLYQASLKIDRIFITDFQRIKRYLDSKQFQGSGSQASKFLVDRLSKLTVYGNEFTTNAEGIHFGHDILFINDIGVNKAG